jgi:hypothetical protein
MAVIQRIWLSTLLSRDVDQLTVKPFDIKDLTPSLLKECAGWQRLQLLKKAPLVENFSEMSLTGAELKRSPRLDPWDPRHVMLLFTSTELPNIEFSIRSKLFDPSKADLDLVTVTEHKLNKFANCYLVRPGYFYSCTNKPTHFPHNSGTMAGLCSDT